MKTLAHCPRLISSAAMREQEAAAIEAGATSGWRMMRRAGRGAVAAIMRKWPDLDWAPRRAVILCGPGNNGGDGFVIAAALLRRDWACDLFLYGARTRLKGDAARACEMFERAGGEVRDWSARSLVAVVAEDPNPALLVEALFGTGLARDCDEALAPVAAALQGRSGIRTVAVDVPAGLHSDTGHRLGEHAFRCDLCVAFHAPKPAHVLGEGPDLIDDLVVIPIGLSEAGAGTSLVTQAGLPDLRKGGGHKFDEGHALVLSGPAGAGGATRLAARAALRVGAGLVTVAVPPDAMAEHAAHLDAIMLREVAEGGALTRLLHADDRINALCLGPGMGTDQHAAGLLEAVLGSGRAAVIDADALTILSQRRILLQRLHGACVLTPHMGEFARLFPDLAKRLDDGSRFTRLEAAQAAAEKVGCTVLLKGPLTAIAAPGQQAVAHAALYERAAPQLATAGAGDVLSGLVAGLLARGLTPVGAAASGAFLHVEAARAFGVGLIAEDLADLVPGVLEGLDVDG
jgi:hydroxyethylthiazole kinase-like uncharacterized protein yjeF